MQKGTLVAYISFVLDFSAYQHNISEFMTIYQLFPYYTKQSRME